LWRNGVLLGRMAVPFNGSDARGFAGLLIPTPEFTDIGALLQSRTHFLPGAPVFLHRDFARANPGPVALKPLSAEERRGVPLDQQFVVLDESGRSLDSPFISIHAMDIPDGIGEFPDACRAAGIPAGPGWTIAVHFPPPNLEELRAEFERHRHELDEP
jgi:hypothetical protein